MLCATPAAARVQTATGDEAVQTAEPPTTRQEILQRQREEKQTDLTPYVVSDAEDRVSRLETFRLPRRIFAKGFGGFRPVLGGMPSGSGFVFGGGYIAGYNHELIQFTANTRYSTRGYTTFDTGVIFPTPASRLPVQAHVKPEVRDLTSLRFYGLGPESSASGRSTYGLEDQLIEAGVTATASQFVEMGATARWVNSTGRRNTSMMRCCNAETETEKVRPGGSACDAFAWSAAGNGACGAATVLEGDRAGAVE